MKRGTNMHNYVKPCLGVLVLLLVLSLYALPGDASAECRITSGATNSVTYSEGQLKDDICDTHGNKPVTVEEFNVCFSGESNCLSDSPDSYIMVNGASVRSTTALTNVTTNATSATFTIPSGGKTPICSVDGTGAVTATIDFYGAMTSTAANGKAVGSQIILSDTTRDVDASSQFTTDYPYYYAVTTNVTGTGATVNCVVSTGITGSGSSSGGAVTNAGTFAVQSTSEPATGVEDAAETAGGTLKMAGTVRRDTAASSAGTAGDNATLNTDGLGRAWIRDGDACSDPARITSAVISESTAATNEIVALNGSDLIYVCGYKWVTTAANNLNWTRGTGADCVTGTTAIEGAQPYAANGGVTENGGGHALFIVPAGNALCLVSSAATAHGGRVTYVRTAAP